ncbi:MAG TPA: hypothetical protein ENG11_06110, partial [candidate division Zixibacteria bacterium]|nr:hypothetical protein [candidate division Zixibacteria bacterium]
MRGGKIFIFVITLTMVVVWGWGGTYRIYTGLGSWKVERISPDPTGPRTAAVVPQGASYCWEGYNVWDDVMNGDVGKPVPWMA